MPPYSHYRSGNQKYEQESQKLLSSEYISSQKRKSWLASREGEAREVHELSAQKRGGCRRRGGENSAPHCRRFRETRSRGREQEAVSYGEAQFHFSLITMLRNIDYDVSPGALKNICSPSSPEFRASLPSAS